VELDAVVCGNRRGLAQRTEQRGSKVASTHTTLRSRFSGGTTVRGTAEALLLWPRGRIDIAGGELDIDGDRTVVTRRNEFLPTS